jgi:pyrimidine dimer DNA glycosylase
VRLWSLHPRYLDPAGLVAVWREALLARAVLAGETRGYRHHPQLIRFRDDHHAIGAYLQAIFDESMRREYRFDETKVPRHRSVGKMTVTSAQLAYEWMHLTAKVRLRNPEWAKRLRKVEKPAAHPLFRVVKGEIETWERL